MFPDGEGALSSYMPGETGGIDASRGRPLAVPLVLDTQTQGVSTSSRLTVIGIGAGQAITRRALIRAMLKVSANDAARLLALDIAGSEERYAEMMNDAAADLALVDTHAANASGLDADGQFSSASHANERRWAPQRARALPARAVVRGHP
jgi:hypothetical protein